MNELFNENLGKASNNKELARLKKKFSQYDPIYVATSTMTTRPDFRNFLEKIWGVYKSYADSNFKNEFKLRFCQRSWELYLGSVLLIRGYKLGKHSDFGPDIMIPFKFGNIWVEAISVEKGIGLNRVPKVKNGIWMDVPEEQMLLRLSSGLLDKYKKYTTYLEKGIISDGDPFIIAIDRSSLEFTDPQIPLILKCLFAIGHQVLFIKSKEQKTQSESSNWSERSSVAKVNGNNVDMLMFKDQTYSGISAIIYSDKNVLNSPKDFKELGDNLVIIYNPYAKNPIPHDYFKFGQSWEQEGSQVKKIILNNKK